jgi:hypothetical protein
MQTRQTSEPSGQSSRAAIGSRRPLTRVRSLRGCAREGLVSLLSLRITLATMSSGSSTPRPSAVIDALRSCRLPQWNQSRKSMRSMQRVGSFEAVSRSGCVRRSTRSMCPHLLSSAALGMRTLPPPPSGVPSLAASAAPHALCPASGSCGGRDRGDDSCCCCGCMSGRRGCSL